MGRQPEWMPVETEHRGVGLPDEEKRIAQYHHDGVIGRQNFQGVVTMIINDGGAGLRIGILDAAGKQEGDDGADEEEDKPDKRNKLTSPCTTPPSPSPVLPPNR